MSQQSSTSFRVVVGDFRHLISLHTKLQMILWSAPSRNSSSAIGRSTTSKQQSGPDATLLVNDRMCGRCTLQITSPASLDGLHSFTLPKALVTAEHMLQSFAGVCFDQVELMFYMLHRCGRVLRLSSQSATKKCGYYRLTALNRSKLDP